MNRVVFRINVAETLKVACELADDDFYDMKKRISSSVLAWSPLLMTPIPKKTFTSKRATYFLKEEFGLIFLSWTLASRENIDALLSQENTSWKMLLDDATRQTNDPYISCTLNEDQLAAHFNPDTITAYADVCFYAWGQKHVYFPAVLNGTIAVSYVPRNPQKII